MIKNCITGSVSAIVSCRNFSDRLVVTVLGGKGRSGFGLFSIRQRIRYMGGECRIASTPGMGTRVELHVPLPSESADDKG